MLNDEDEVFEPETFGEKLRSHTMDIMLGTLFLSAIYCGYKEKNKPDLTEKQQYQEVKAETNKFLQDSVIVYSR